MKSVGGCTCQKANAVQESTTGERGVFWEGPATVHIRGVSIPISQGGVSAVGIYPALGQSGRRSILCMMAAPTMTTIAAPMTTTYGAAPTVAATTMGAPTYF